MHNDTTEPFWFPAVGRKKVTAAFDGGRLTSDGGVMLLAAAERRIGIAHRLAGLIADPRNPLLVTHSVVDILRARMLAIFCGTIDGDRPLKTTKANAASPIDANSGIPIRMATSHTPTISIICAPTPASNWPADVCLIPVMICALSRRCRVGRMRRVCVRWCA